MEHTLPSIVSICHLENLTQAQEIYQNSKEKMAQKIMT